MSELNGLEIPDEEYAHLDSVRALLDWGMPTDPEGQQLLAEALLYFWGRYVRLVSEHYNELYEGWYDG